VCRVWVRGLGFGTMVKNLGNMIKTVRLQVDLGSKIWGLGHDN
jgi:hypothetical protein